MRLHDFFFGSPHLEVLNSLLCWWGVIMCVWCHQMWGQGLLGNEHSHIVNTIQRGAYLMISLSFLWTMAYAHVKGWEPWPSVVLTEAAVDAYLASVLWVALKRGLVWR